MRGCVCAYVRGKSKAKKSSDKSDLSDLSDLTDFLKTTCLISTAAMILMAVVGATLVVARLQRVNAVCGYIVI